MTTTTMIMTSTMTPRPMRAVRGRRPHPALCGRVSRLSSVLLSPPKSSDGDRLYTGFSNANVYGKNESKSIGVNNFVCIVENCWYCLDCFKIFTGLQTFCGSSFQMKCVYFEDTESPKFTIFGFGKIFLVDNKM